MVSALVSVYNAPKFIEGCLVDLTDQTLYKQGQLEIIVVDSASPGNEKPIIERFTDNFHNIKYYRTDVRETLSSAWNLALRHSSGNYLTIANCDDRHRLDAIETLAEVLNHNPQIELVFADAIESSIMNETFAECNSINYYTYPEFNYENCLHHHQFGHQPLWRKSLHKQIGLFAPHLQAVGDGEFNIRFNLHKRKALHFGERLGLFFQNPNSLTNDSSIQLEERKIMKAKYRNESNIIKLLKFDGNSCFTMKEVADTLLKVGVKSLFFKTPWSKQYKSDLEFSAFCFQSAIKYSPKSNAIRNNLTELLKVFRNEKALDTSLFSSQIEKGIFPVVLPPSKNEKLVIACFAGDENNFSFFAPIKNYLENRGYIVNCYNASEINEELLLKILDESDLVWCEWANGPAITISQLAHRPPMIVRLHRYEAYDGTINNINWFGVEKLITVNPEFINVIKKYHEPEIDNNVSIVHIPNSVSSQIKFREHKNNFRIAYISRFQKDKNPQLMIQVLSALVKKDPRYSIYMVGRIQDYQLYDYCIHLINELGLQNNFFYEGTVENIEEWLGDKSIILSTSIVESQGLGLMEAMMMGIKPVIHNGYGNLRNIYGDDLVFNTIDEAVELITANEYDSERYRSLVEKKYGSDIILPQVESIICQLLNSMDNNPSQTSVSIETKQQTKENTPFISICIPVYNREDFIEAAVDSALSQTFRNFEIVIVDDGSTDGTKDLLQNYSSNKQVRIIFKSHTNAPDTRNRAVTEATGDYILWLDSDDILYPEILEKYRKLLIDYPNTDAIYCKLVSIGEETNVIHQYQDWQNRIDDAIRYLLYGSPIPNPGLLIKRTILREFQYDTAFHRAHDYELWSRILPSLNINVKYLPEVLVQYRIHADNLSGRMKPHIDLSFDARIINNILQKRDLSFFFPNFNWQYEREISMDAANMNIAMKFLQLNDITGALTYIAKIKNEAHKQKFEPLLRKYNIGT